MLVSNRTPSRMLSLSRKSGNGIGSGGCVSAPARPNNANELVGLWEVSSATAFFR